MTRATSVSEVEIWRLVPSVPGYMASSYGRIMRIPWIGETPFGKRQYGGAPTFGTWEPISKRFVTRIGDKSYRIARMVCEAFHGEPTFGGAICMHMDENSKNNTPANLAWGTHKQNLNAPGYLAYRESCSGENSTYAKRKERLSCREP